MIPHRTGNTRQLLLPGWVLEHLEPREATYGEGAVALNDAPCGAAAVQRAFGLAAHLGSDLYVVSSTLSVRLYVDAIM